MSTNMSGPIGSGAVRSPSKSRGFTIVELLTTIAMLAILAGLALPAMGGLLAKWHRDSTARTLIAHLQLARATAIKSTKKVVMCNSLDGMQCAPSGHSEWSTGWLIFQDNNLNNVLDPAEAVIASTGPTPGIASLASSNKVRRFVFLPNGLMSAGMSSLVIKPASGSSLKVVINRTGRFRLVSETT